MNAVAISIQLLISVQENGDYAPFLLQLASISEEQLSSDLKSVDAGKTFWINCYNALTQILIEKKSPDLSSQAGRLDFFSSKEIEISGQKLSLNDMEHGMLRHSAVWWSKGHLHKLFPGGFEKKFRVPLDYRIHFALNCGANSCPPIRFYETEKLNDQLNEAMNAFLNSDVKYNKERNAVTISPIFDWYRTDFGGKKGILNLLHKENLIPANKNVQVEFGNYNWTTLLHKFEQ